jgi:hypothetical protein
MFLRPQSRNKDGKDHTCWSLVETVRTPDGPRQKTLCYPGELNSSAQARWLTTVEVFNERGAARLLKLFPSHVAAPPDDPQVARVLLNKVRLERTRQFGSCFPELDLWRRLELDRFFEQTVDQEAADVPWSRVAALPAINRLCAPGSELAIEQRWYRSTALDDLLEIEEGKINVRACIVVWTGFCRTRQAGAAPEGTIRRRGGPYLTGTPRSQMKRFEAELLQDDWTRVRSEVEVKKVAIPEGEETYILCCASGRQEKEKAIRNRFSNSMEIALKGLEKAIATGRLKDRNKMERRPGKSRHAIRR